MPSVGAKMFISGSLAVAGFIILYVGMFKPEMKSRYSKKWENEVQGLIKTRDQIQTVKKDLPQD